MNIYGRNTKVSTGCHINSDENILDLEMICIPCYDFSFDRLLFLK
jgi:hypothetical protein